MKRLDKSYIWLPFYVKIMPLVKKCYHCKVIDLTNTKQMALEQEYDNYLQTKEDLGLYSANKLRPTDSIR